MPRCMVLGCTSGYKTTKEKSHFFNVPQDPQALELWRNAIGRTDISIKSGQSVCDKHFRKEEIVWKRELRGSDGAVIGISPYKIPRLVKGSTPSIFSSLECATKPGSSVKLENVLCPEGASTEAIDCSNNQSSDAVPAIPDKNESVIEECTEENVPVDCGIALPTEMHDESSHEPVTPVTIGELIRLNLTLVPGWVKRNMRRDDTTSVLFCKLEYCRGSDALKTFPLKEVIITSDLSVHVNVLHYPLNITDLEIELGSVLTIKQLQNLLLKLDELKVCTGSKLQTELDKNDRRVVNKDISGTWRHVQCSLLLSNITVCQFCQRIKKTAARKIQRSEIRGQTKRILLRLSPNKKKTLLQLQGKLNTVKKAVRRAKKSIFVLKSDLDACQEKLKSYSEKSLQQLLETVKLPKNQVHALVLKEILAAKQLKDCKGR